MGCVTLLTWASQTSLDRNGKGESFCVNKTVWATRYTVYPGGPDGLVVNFRSRSALRRKSAMCRLGPFRLGGRFWREVASKPHEVRFGLLERT